MLVSINGGNPIVGLFPWQIPSRNGWGVALMTLEPSKWPFGGYAACGITGGSVGAGEGGAAAGLAGGALEGTAASAASGFRGVPHATQNHGFSH